jgi:hypothetical protein
MAKRAAIKGLSKLLRKGTKGKRPRGTPTKAAMMARRGMLRGETTAEKLKKTMGDPQKALRKQKKKPLVGKFEVGVGTGAAGTLAYQKIKEGKKAKAKADKEKLKKKTTHHYEKAKKKQKDYRRSKK